MLVLSIMDYAEISANAQQLQQKGRAARIERRSEKRARKTTMGGEIQFSGAFALYPLVVRWQEEFQKIYPNIKIDISAGGAGKGITDALSGVVDMGMVSREVHQVEMEKGAFVIKVAKDAVVATVNSRNPLSRELLTRGLTTDVARNIWSGKIKTWGEIVGNNSSLPVHAYTRSDACGAAETWGAWISMRQEQIEGLAVFGDPGVASVVQKDKLAIGFNNIAYAYDLRTKKPHRGIMVMPIDLDGNGRIDLNESFYATLDELNAAIVKGLYPKPPARELYLVCKGRPQKAEVLAFLEFILSPKGQALAPEAGFVPLPLSVAQEELDKL